jgi:tetratricopeptide (TPR) repeat protein
MSKPTSEKLEKLFALLQRAPGDTFLLYGIALEYKKLNAHSDALEYLDKAIATDTNYAYAFYQKGQVYELMSDAQSAKTAYTDGIAAAKRGGDAHANEELARALQELEQNG